MTAMPVPSVPFSDVIRHPTKTPDALPRARALRRARRDAIDLVLMSADRADAEAEIVDLSARLIAQLVKVGPELVRTALLLALPWVRFLPAADVALMADEFVSTTEAASSVGNTAAVTQLLAEWRHTAEVHADPELFRALTAQESDDFGAVPRPPAA